MPRYVHQFGIGLVVLSILAVGCGPTTTPNSTTPSKDTSNQSSTTPKAKQTSVEQPVAPEQNPTGDIPDTQAFVTYNSPKAGYHLDVPEGWARSAQSADVSFVDKLDGVKVSVTKGSLLTASDLQSQHVLNNLGRAVRVQSVTQIPNSNLNAIKVVYSSNSDPDPVTGKQVRLEDNTFFFFKAGKVVKLTVWAPLGSDNVDQWNRISTSFRW